MPAQAGIQARLGEVQRVAWIPAFAGMTDERRERRIFARQSMHRSMPRGTVAAVI